MTIEYAFFLIVLTAAGLLMFVASKRIRARRDPISNEATLPSGSSPAVPSMVENSPPVPWPSTQAALRRINRRPTTDDDRAIYLVAHLIGYLENEGLGDFLFAARSGDDGLEPFVKGLERVGASQMVPFLERGEVEYDTYIEACDANPIPTESPEGQRRVREHLDRMHSLEDEMRASGPDLMQILETFAAGRAGTGSV